MDVQATPGFIKLVFHLNSRHTKNKDKNICENKYPQIWPEAAWLKFGDFLSAENSRPAAGRGSAAKRHCRLWGKFVKVMWCELPLH